MNIKVYGIPPDVYRCVGCEQITEMLGHLTLSYRFDNVIYMGDQGVEYNYEAIEAAARYTGVWPSKRVRYPVVVIDELVFTSPKQVRYHLEAEGYDLSDLD